MIRDLSVDYPDFLIASSEWYTVLKVKDYFENPGDHADEVETSVMMHYHPELVNLEEAGSGEYKTFRYFSPVSGNPCYFFIQRLHGKGFIFSNW